MHYKKAIALALTLMTSISANAADWPYDNDTLKSKLDSAYGELEDKTGFCRGLRDRQLTSIASDWLNELPEKKQRFVLFVVYVIASRRCTAKEEANYTRALLNYTSETGDNRFLDDWIILNKMRFDKELIGELEGIPNSKIIELTNRPELYYPFEPMGSYKLIIPESK